MAAHWQRVIITTRRGPRMSVGRAQASAPMRAEICTTM